MSKLRLTMACWNYDRVAALVDGRVRPEGIDLTILNLPVEETFFRMIRHREFDIAEMSLSSYVVSLFDADPPFIAIPIFPSRAFRHSAIYINANSGIRAPRDLAGKKVGTPEYQLTACVWVRGLLADEYEVPLTSVIYCTGGQEEPGRAEKQRLQLPADIQVQPIAAGKTLAAMLANAEIDALYAPRAPSTLYTSPAVKRLFEDFVTVEREYFSRTQIFPIMHTVVIRRDVYQRDPWVARSLFKAWSLAQQETYRDLRETAALKVMLPWLAAHAEETRRLMGDDFWPYGLDANRKTLATFLGYAWRQGLAKRQLTPEELFAAETLESFRI